MVGEGSPLRHFVLSLLMAGGGLFLSPAWQGSIGGMAVKPWGAQAQVWDVVRAKRMRHIRHSEAGGSAPKREESNGTDCATWLMKDVAGDRGRYQHPRLCASGRFRFALGRVSPARRAGRGPGKLGDSMALSARVCRDRHPPADFPAPHASHRGDRPDRCLAESPTLVLLAETDFHWTRLRESLLTGRIAGPKVHDARIAALCSQLGVRELWSADRDFGRFPDLVIVNPLMGAPSS